MEFTSFGEVLSRGELLQLHVVLSSVNLCKRSPPEGNRRKSCHSMNSLRLFSTSPPPDVDFLLISLDLLQTGEEVSGIHEIEPSFSKRKQRVSYRDNECPSFFLFFSLTFLKTLSAFRFSSYFSILFDGKCRIMKLQYLAGKTSLSRLENKKQTTRRRAHIINCGTRN